MEEPGYFFRFTLYPEEAREAIRRVRYFRLGHATGIVVHLLLVPTLLLASILGILSLFLPARDPGAAICGCITLLAALFISVNAVRSITTFAHPLPRNLPEVQLFIGDTGIRIHHAEGPFNYPWTEFTALLWTDNTYMIMTTTAFVPIPKREVPSELTPGFEMYVRSKCLKQGISHDFPVLLNPPTLPLSTAFQPGDPQGREKPVTRPPA